LDELCIKLLKYFIYKFVFCISIVSVPIFSDDVAVKACLVECLESVLNKCQEPVKSKKVQHSNAKNAVLFEAIYLIIHIEWYADTGACLYSLKRIRHCSLSLYVKFPKL